jgi:hypothetical protein
LFGQHEQVVGVELVTPVGMLAVLGKQQFPQGQTQGRMLALVGAGFAP